MLLNNDLDIKKAISVYDRTEKLPEVKLKRLLRSQTVQNMITEEIIKLYESNGITADHVIKEEKTILETAKNKEDLTNAIKILANWRESLDLKPKQTQVTTTTTDYLRLINKDNEQLEAKRETKQLKKDNEKPDNND